MATLLHIDSSVFPGSASASRAVTDAFRKAWEEQHPEGTVIYRDLAANPVPHITADAHTAGFAAPAAHTPEQAAAFAARVKLIEELEQADAVLIGAPMYNFAIPSTLKAWLDNVILMGRTAGRGPVRQGHPGHRRRQPRRLLRAGHPARGLRVRAELPGGHPARHPRPGPRLHRPGTHDGPAQPGDVRADPPLRGLPRQAPSTTRPPRPRNSPSASPRNPPPLQSATAPSTHPV